MLSKFWLLVKVNPRFAILAFDKPHSYLSDSIDLFYDFDV
jgi:hypothetical protein